jgi:3-methyladenine DNA glycosylase AlkD
MTAAQIMKQLEQWGTDSYRKIIKNHGAKDPIFGVKIEQMKTIQKKVKKDHQLSLDLFDTGNYDAQYLAGLIADETKISPKELKQWLAKANCPAICGSPVAWVAAESPHGHKLAMEWIESKDENTAQTGWTVLSSLVSIRDDSQLDVDQLKKLLKRVEQTIHQQPNRVRYAMNGFVIAAGSCVKSLTDLAIQTGKKVGQVTVDMGNTACQVPFAPDYIQKVQKRGTIGKKRKMARC